MTAAALAHSLQKCKVVTIKSNAKVPGKIAFVKVPEHPLIQKWPWL